jgi:4-amino-4-deoxy-L-arabinose transferase-like glycosyltransferase
VHAPLQPKTTTLSRSSRLKLGLALAVLLIAALALRLYSIRFGLPALNDPDELTFELGALKMLRGGSLNPGWFGHPATTTMYLLAVLTIAVYGVGHLLGRFPTIEAFGEAIYADPSWVMLPGRVAMAVFAVATIYLTWRLARELLGPRVAFAAAAMLAINPVHITWSQIIRSDMMACFFMLLCMLAALRIAREDRWRDHVWAALWLGAAMATKWPYAISALAIVGVALLRITGHPEHRRRSLVRLALGGAMAIGFLLLISPYLVLDHATALRHVLGEAQVHHLGATGGSPWDNAVWYVGGPILTGLGIAGLALAAWGVVLLGHTREARAVMLPVMAGFFVLFCIQNLVWERWVLPLMPLLAIAAAAGLAALCALAARRLPPHLATGAAALAIAATLLPPALRAQGDARARLNDTRQMASQWARANVPPGSSVLVEHFAFDLEDAPWDFLFPLGDAGCINARALLHGKVQFQTVDANRGSRSNIDYGTIAPAMRRTCRTDYALITQYDRYAAERARFPAEYAAYRDLLAKGRLVATFAPSPGEAGGPIVRVVRFAD